MIKKIIKILTIISLILVLFIFYLSIFGIKTSKFNNQIKKKISENNKEIHDVKGLGLGLYYTNQIIKAHNGHIDVKSKNGKGTTFTLTIPFN